MCNWQVNFSVKLLLYLLSRFSKCLVYRCWHLPGKISCHCWCCIQAFQQLFDNRIQRNLSIIKKGSNIIFVPILILLSLTFIRDSLLTILVVWWPIITDVPWLHTTVLKIPWIGVPWTNSAKSNSRLIVIFLSTLAIVNVKGYLIWGFWTGFVAKLM